MFGNLYSVLGFMQKLHPTHTPTLASQVGSKAAVGGIAVLGLTFVIAVFRQVGKFRSPKAVRSRTMNKNKASLFPDMIE